MASATWRTASRAAGRSGEISPPDKFGLTKDQRIQLQKRLTAKGFDTDGADGVIGPNSRKAIAAYQSSIGRAATGDPSVDLLQTL